MAGIRGEEREGDRCSKSTFSIANCPSDGYNCFVAAPAASQVPLVYFAASPPSTYLGACHRHRVPGASDSTLPFSPPINDFVDELTKYIRENILLRVNHLRPFHGVRPGRIHYVPSSCSSARIEAAALFSAGCRGDALVGCGCQPGPLVGTLRPEDASENC